MTVACFGYPESDDCRNIFTNLDSKTIILTGQIIKDSIRNICFRLSPPNFNILKVKLASYFSLCGVKLQFLKWLF